MPFWQVFLGVLVRFLHVRECVILPLWLGSFYGRR